MVEHKGQAGAESGRDTPLSTDQTKITEAMLDAGEDAIWGRVGGCQDLGGYFSARELALEVYLAMDNLRGNSSQ